VKISVKQSGHYANPFDSTIGVKQGDVLSPTLFNLYINDLPGQFNDPPEEPNKSYDRVTLNDRQISCLLYADDLVLISKSKNGLQNCLNKLSKYCQEWQMEVNLEKTKIMIMSKSGRKIKDTLFLGDQQLENVRQYTYLGLTMTSSGSFTATKMNLKTKAQKANGRLKKLLGDTSIKKSIGLKLFDQLVRPILTYGCEVWGPIDINSTMCREDNEQILEAAFDKLPQERLNNSFAKFLIGVSTRTSNIAVRGELGRYPLYIYIINQLKNYYDRLENCNEDSLLHAAFIEQKTLSVQCSNSWLTLTKSMLEHYGLQHINKLKTRAVLNKETTKHIQRKYDTYWNGKLNKSPKLDTYRKFKQNIQYEPYLDMIENKQHQISLTRLRLSNHRLQIEQGRYAKQRADREQRLCPICDLGEVEDEEHFLYRCTALSNDRDELLNEIIHAVPQIGTDIQSLLGNYTQQNIRTIAKYIHTAMNKRLTILQGN